MSQIDSGSARIRTLEPMANVYTVLALITVLVLAVAVGFVWWQNVLLTGDSNPFLMLGQIRLPFTLV